MENELPSTHEHESGEAVRPDNTTPKRRKGPAKKGSVREGATTLVVLFRHGISAEPVDGVEDADRSLTTAGHDRTKRAARGLAKIVGKVDAIHSSPYLRALQSALWLTKAWNGKVRVQTTDALRPDANPEEVQKIVAEAKGTRIILVGHEPNLTGCAARLLGAPDLNVNLRRAGCIGIRIDAEGRGQLEWILAPRTLRDL